MEKREDKKLKNKSQFFLRKMSPKEKNEGKAKKNQKWQTSTNCQEETSKNTLRIIHACNNIPTVMFLFEKKKRRG